MTIKVDRGVRLNHAIHQAVFRHPADQAVAVLVALIGLATALSKSEFIGRVISTFDADWRYQEKMEVPPLRSRP